MYVGCFALTPFQRNFPQPQMEMLRTFARQRATFDRSVLVGSAAQDAC